MLTQLQHANLVKDIGNAIGQPVPRRGGSWSFLSRRLQLNVGGGVSDFAFAYCILDIVWEFLRYAAIFLEYRISGMSQSLARKTDISWDSRIRLVSKLVPDRLVNPRLAHFLSISTRILPLFYKSFFLIYFTVNILQYVSDNGLTGENYWTFGQIFVMVNVFGMLAILISHITPPTVSISTGAILWSSQYSRAGQPSIWFVLAPASVVGFYLTIFKVHGAISNMDFFNSCVNSCVANAIIGSVLSLSAVLGVMLILIFLLSLVVMILYRSSKFIESHETLRSVVYGVDQAFRSVVSSDLLSSVIVEKEMKAIDAWVNEMNQHYYIERRTNVYDSTGNLSASISDWTRLSQLLFDDWWPRYRLADAYERLGDAEMAISIWEMLVIRNDNSSLRSLIVDRL